MNNKWLVNYTNREEWDCDYDFIYDTREDAIQGGIEGIKDYCYDNFEENSDEEKEYLEDGVFYVGQINTPTFDIDATQIIDNIAEQYGEQCGEHAENWLTLPYSWQYRKDMEDKFNELKEKQEKEFSLLEDRFNRVFQEWMEETGNEPTFYSVNKISEHRVKELIESPERSL